MFNSKLAELLPYQVGGLLYAPAFRSDIVTKIREGGYPGLTSAALCLEDSVRDEALERAEQFLKDILSALEEFQRQGGTLPLLFVRIRTPRHLEHVHRLLAGAGDVLTGYVLPKFDLSNAGDYAGLMERLCRSDGTPLFYMPILESRMIADAAGRAACLTELKQVCDARRDRILNVRVGGTDLCNLYGLRRSERQTIYDVGVVRDILADIINVFGGDYVVSGPVWEYFGGNPRGAWAEGLRRELELDRLNGFVGKTSIHPCQLPLIQEGMKVSRRDYEDAMRILRWDEETLGVAKGGGGDRMNEVKCHTRWARRVAALAQVYGVLEDTEVRRCEV